jgi:hypothetical protein
MPTTLNDWKPYSQKIDNSGLREGRFASGAFTMIAAGPPRLSALPGAVAQGSGAAAALTSLSSDPQANWALPIGVVQNFNLAHNRNFARFWELGSERSYFISGRTVAQAGFSRVLYNGPSLLRVMYAFYQDPDPTLVRSFNLDSSIMSGVMNQHDVKIPPGFENIYLNLASDLFSQPCGLLVYMKDSNENTLGAVYLEETYIPSHSIATDAQGVVIQEQVSLQPERVVPIAFAQVALIENSQFADIYRNV